uniref:Uncharacterized protein n=1 Tax=Cannabis sativa TaxID=3483 RepID=A0A803PG79_CANSA
MGLQERTFCCTSHGHLDVDEFFHGKHLTDVDDLGIVLIPPDTERSVCGERGKEQWPSLLISTPLLESFWSHRVLIRVAVMGWKNNRELFHWKELTPEFKFVHTAFIS